MKAFVSRYKTTLLLGCLACLLVALIAGATVATLRETRKTAFDHFADDNEAIALATASSLEDILTSRLQDVTDISRRLESARQSRRTKLLEELCNESKGSFSGTGIMEPDGSINHAYPSDADGTSWMLPVQSPSSITGVTLGIDDAGHLIAWKSFGDKQERLFVIVSGEYVNENYFLKLGRRLEREVMLFNEQGYSWPVAGRISVAVAPSKESVGAQSVKGGFALSSSSGAGENLKKEHEMNLSYVPFGDSGKGLYLGIATPRSDMAGYLVKSPALIVTLAATRVAAVLTCAIVFLVFDKRRRKASDEATRLKEEQKLLVRLEESEERYRTLVENLQSPVVIFQEGRIRFANPAYYNLTGYTPEEVADEAFDLYSVVHEEDRQLSLENTARLLDGEKIETPREIRYVKKNGEMMVGLVFSSLIHFDGKRAIETVVFDITHIKKIEQELGQTRRRLQYLLDNAPIMIFSLDQTGNFSYANKETLRVTGYRFEDWIGKPFAPIVHPDDLAVAVSNFEEGRRGTRRRDYKLRIRNAAGKVRTLHILSDNIQEKDQFKGSLIIASDITEQQRLQQTIRETRDHLSNIIENAGDAIITLDTDGNIVSWNKSAETMFHLVSPDAFHKPMRTLLNVKNSETQEIFGRVTDGETVRDVEFDCMREGKRFDALFTFSPIRDASGKVIGISCFARDITERRLLEEQLERDKLFIDQLIENANVLIAAANEQGKLVIFNRRFEEVSGYTKEEALGKDPLDLLLPKEARKETAKRFASIRTSEPIMEIEVPIISKEGRHLTVSWNAAAVNLPSGNAAIVVVGQDVTGQKRMHEELMQSKKLASIGELVSGVAHELNNPLTIIMGYSQLLVSEKILEDRHREMSQKVLDAAGRSKRIVENLLAFARKKKLKKHQVDINEILENTLMLREHNLNVNNIAIVRDYEEHLPPMYADSHQLQQVFLNLINNAYDAMFEANRGGTLHVRTCKKNDHIVIEVKDDGPGVPEAFQEKIFDPFFTTKEVGKGTGLGMSLSYGIINEHGGRIYLDKTYRPGAKFIIEFPLTQNSNASAQASHV